MRDDRIWPSVYLGRPGALTTLPYPRGGIVPAYERSSFDFVTGSGQHRVSKLAEGSRVWDLVWNALQMDTYADIEAYDRGHNGTGPFALLDPSRINLLTANQSSATGVRKGTTGFTTSAANQGSLFSNTNATHIHRAGGQRSLEWRFSVAPVTSPLVTLSTVYAPWYGIPVVPGQSYTFSVWVKPDGTIDASITVAAKISWRNTADAEVSVATTADTAVGAWTRLVVTGVAPVGAAFGSLRLVATGATITVGGSLFIDEMQFEQSTAVTDWVPGTGVYPVETLGFSESVPFAAAWRVGPTLTVREVVG